MVAKMRWPRCADYGPRRSKTGQGCADMVAKMRGPRTSAPVDCSPDHDNWTDLDRPWRLIRLACDTGRGPGLIALFISAQ